MQVVTIKFDECPEKIRIALHKDNKTLLTFETITLGWNAVLRSFVQVIKALRKMPPLGPSLLGLGKNVAGIMRK